jgi:hypothetical protein
MGIVRHGGISANDFYCILRSFKLTRNGPMDSQIAGYFSTSAFVRPLIGLVF